jgi:hypothetical protein
LTDRCYQCIIPVFDGLLPEPHNSSILRLLFTCTHWHGLAKLRIHTDSTLRILDEVTVSTGTEFHAFTAKTCAAFDTRELSREVDARKRRELKKSREKSTSNGQSMLGDQIASGNHVIRDGQPAFTRATSVPGSTDRRGHNGPKRRKFNLTVYKYHALGDYAKTIRRLGTTDSFSTEPVSN